MVIINATMHDATPEQIAAGVIEPSCKDEIRELLTFNEIPTRNELSHRAARITVEVDIFASNEGHRGKEEEVGVMIGGAPYLMKFLEHRMILHGFKPLYAFSKRDSVDEVQPDGAVIKKAVFRHAGFVEA